MAIDEQPPPDRSKKHVKLFKQAIAELEKVRAYRANPPDLPLKQPKTEDDIKCEESLEPSQQL
jgi:hypothetical protein